MDWMQIISAIALIMFIVILYPATREMIKNNPQGASSDWASIVVPLLAVILIVMFLVALV
ncbi:MAG: hypothetical protein JSR51_10430 [Proteobacteria bacterium]|jgi:hypothetical protein|nr:hypothetical protein [Pseudomonadota bacterium]